ncbi:hypothetical protein PINS_up011319 [Pythium insidiosum]|nr:hypothetical protein PINS_up011319 [Pythium insidiosum]
MLGRALKEVKLPFPDDFFPECRIPDRDREVYRRAAESKLAETLATSHHFQPARSPEQWKLVGERHALQLFRERGVAQGSAVAVVARGSLPSTLEDVLWGLHAASTATLKTQQLILHADAFVDAAVLHVDDADAERGSFSGIKWLACAPSGKLMHKRDLCWHELMGSTMDADGRDVGFLVMQSVRIPECPPFEHQGVVRSSASVCYVFRAQANGNVAVYMHGEHAVGGKSRSWSSDGFMVEMWLAVANVLECAQSKRLSRLVRGKDVFFATQTKVCEICDQRVSLLKFTENCKICGKSVCDKCRLAKAVFPTRHTSTAFPCVLAFCKRCLSDVRDQTYVRGPRLSGQSELASSHSSGSISGRSSLGVGGTRSSGAHLAAGSRRPIVSPPESTKSTSSMAATDATFSFSELSSSLPPPHHHSFGRRHSRRPFVGASMDDLASSRASLSSVDELSRPGSLDGAPVLELPERPARAFSVGAGRHAPDDARLRPRPRERELEAGVDVFHADKLKYINTFTADSTGGLANPSAAAAAMPSAVPDERQRLMERLLQANMTAEATYLLAKYSSNLAQQSADNNR